MCIGYPCCGPPSFTTPSRASCLLRCILKLALIFRNNICAGKHTCVSVKLLHTRVFGQFNGIRKRQILTCVCSSGRSSEMASCIFAICLQTFLKQVDGIGAFTSYWRRRSVWSSLEENFYYYYWLGWITVKQ